MKTYSLNSSPAMFKVSGQAWLGIDAHRDVLSFTVVNEASQVVDHGRIPNRKQDVDKLLDRYKDVKLTAAYEAGPTGYSLVRWIQSRGVDAFMTPPSLIPTAPGDRVKTDSRDSLKLALLNRNGALKRVQERTDQDYADRALMRCRDQAVSERSDIVRQIKSLALFHSLDLDAQRGLTKAVIVKLEALEEELRPTRPSLAAALKIHLMRYRNAHRAVLECDRQCRKLVERTPYPVQRKLLLTIPGIGEHSADRLCTELGDIKQRFAHPDKLSAYLGLTPCEYSTGDKQKRGHITRLGNRQARSTLVEAAWVLIRRDPKVDAAYQELKRRRGAKIAIVATARKLAHVIFAMVRDNIAYIKAKQANPKQANPKQANPRKAA